MSRWKLEVFMSSNSLGGEKGLAEGLGGPDPNHSLSPEAPTPTDPPSRPSPSLQTLPPSAKLRLQPTPHINPAVPNPPHPPSPCSMCASCVSPAQGAGPSSGQAKFPPRSQEVLLISWRG